MGLVPKRRCIAIELRVGVAGSVDDRRAVEAVIGEPAPAAGRCGLRNARGVRSDAGDPAALQQGFGFRPEPAGVTGLAGDSSCRTISELLKECPGRGRIEGEAGRELHEMYGKLSAERM